MQYFIVPPGLIYQTSLVVVAPQRPRDLPCKEVSLEDKWPRSQAMHKRNVVYMYKECMQLILK